MLSSSPNTLPDLCSNSVQPNRHPRDPGKMTHKVNHQIQEVDFYMVPNEPGQSFEDSAPKFPGPRACPLHPHTFRSMQLENLHLNSYNSHASNLF